MPVTAEQLGAPLTPNDAEAFPTLDEAELDAIACFGTTCDLQQGDLLFERGQRSVDFFVCRTGCVEIIEEQACGEDKVVTVHGPAQFTGELDLFNDREILVSGRMGADGRVIRVRRDRFRDLLAAEPELARVITAAFILRRLGLVENRQGGVQLVGDPEDGKLLTIQRFLVRNAHPQTVHDIGNAQGKARHILTHHDFTEADCPVVLCPDGSVLTRPSLGEVADCIGLSQRYDRDRPFDVAVVGAGPAGLAAAVYAASEGLSTLILESEAPGGQAGTSSRIENYLGFPLGLSGQELATRAQIQAEKFGAILALPCHVDALELTEDGFRLTISEGDDVRARSVVCATGARYRRLDVPGYDTFEASSIHYAATAVEAEFCSDREIHVVGGGNSAGQAAVFLSKKAKHVHVLVRGEGLAESMSSYLIERIEASERITLHTHSAIAELHGSDGRLEHATVEDSRSGDTREMPMDHLFMMIGAAPNTDWVGSCVARDDKGFVLTGAEIPEDRWSLERPPHVGEASCPGFFAVGDCRSGSVKRVASAVGEGSVCVAALHRVLAAV